MELLKKLLHLCLLNRKQFVPINNFKSKFEPVTYGVLQGSILGPLLRHINDLAVSLNTMPRLLAVSLNTMPRLLADDTALLIHESSLSKIGELASLANSELLSISK